MKANHGKRFHFSQNDSERGDGALFDNKCTFLRASFWGSLAGW